MEASKKIVEALKKASKPLKSGELSTLSGISAAQVNSSLKILQKEGKIFSPKRCYYQLKNNK